LIAAVAATSLVGSLEDLGESFGNDRADTRQASADYTQVRFESQANEDDCAIPLKPLAKMIHPRKHYMG
jgi:hypothetical protein